MIRLGLALGVLVITSSACASQPSPPQGGTEIEPGRGPDVVAPTVTTTDGPTMSGTDVESPPPFRLRYGGHELALKPYTWCYRNGCVDGISVDPPSVGGPTSIRVQVPVKDWDLVATFTPVGERCGRQQTVEPAMDEDGWFVLKPAGPPDRYHVDLFAQGGGDMVARFMWATPQQGQLPTPESRLALIANHDGRPDSYGVELMLSNLVETPAAAHARITVTAGNGRSLTFDTTRAHGCWPEGTAYFDGPDAEGLDAAALGGFPFHYIVTVTLDGATYKAVADYPVDEIDGNEPSVALEFTPRLPALT